MEEQIEALVIQKSAKDARIKELEADNKRLEAAFMKLKESSIPIRNAHLSEEETAEYKKQKAREALERIRNGE